MSKIIRLGEEDINGIRDDIINVLRNMKMFDGKVSISRTLGTIDRKATLYFTEMAYTKMQYLVREFNNEVAWHGLVKRSDDPNKDEYIVYDILVYPQEVTGTTVNTDQEKYQTWLFSQEDDVFNNIRLQGHSHVNMGVTPSSVDNSLYERLLDQLEGDMFYVFLIWNKRDERTIKIYDLKKNVLFETADVDVRIVEDGTGLESFINGAKDMVKYKSYSYYGSSASSNMSGGYYGNGNYTVKSGTKPGSTSPLAAAPSISDQSQPKKKKKKKTGGSESGAMARASVYHGGSYDDYDDDDDDSSLMCYGGWR